MQAQCGHIPSILTFGIEGSLRFAFVIGSTHAVESVFLLEGFLFERIGVVFFHFGSVSTYKIYIFLILPAE